MATNNSIKFCRVDGIAYENLVAGAIYFDKESGTIHIATSDTTTDKFGGDVADATWNDESSTLNIVKNDGTVISLNFSDMASASAVDSALNLRNVGSEDFLGNIDDIILLGKNSIVLSSNDIEFSVNSELGAMRQGVLYLMSTDATNITIADFEHTTESVLEYHLVFKTSDSGTTIAVPRNIYWANGDIPQIEPSTYYELNILSMRIDDVLIFRAIMIPFKQV